MRLTLFWVFSVHGTNAVACLGIAVPSSRVGSWCWCPGASASRGTSVSSISTLILLSLCLSARGCWEFLICIMSLSSQAIWGWEFCKVGRVVEKVLCSDAGEAPGVGAQVRAMKHSTSLNESSELLAFSAAGLDESQDSPVEIGAITKTRFCCLSLPWSVCVLAVPGLGTAQSSRDLLAISCRVRGRAERLRLEP